MSHISWIHLSDLHFGRHSDYTYQENVIIDELIKDIKNLISNYSLRIDMLFITGDVVFSGDKSSYLLMSMHLDHILAALGLSKVKVYVIPGNHDFKRDSFLSGLPVPKTMREVDEIIGNKDKLHDYLSGFEDFHEFCSKLTGFSDYRNSLYTTDSTSINGHSVSIVGLNTAWYCRGDDVGQGDIILGSKQVRDSLQNANDSEVIIALMHHPFSWLSEEDIKYAKPILENRADFILTGHIHKSDDIGTHSIFRKSFHISSGALFENGSTDYAYNIVDCNLDTGTGRIYFRKYVHEGGFFSSDNSLSPDVGDGIATFFMPSKIPVNNRADIKHFTSSIPKQQIEISKILKYQPIIPKVLMKSIKNGECVLFAGAGTSIDGGLPLWRELMVNLIEKTDECICLEEGIKNELFDLLDSNRPLIVAEYCRERLGEHNFSDFLMNNLKTKNRVSKTHELLAKIPFVAAITTNYDTFLEKNRMGSRVLLPDEIGELGYSGIRRVAEDLFPIVKLHGTLDNPRSVVFSDSDYRRAMYSRPEYRRAIMDLLAEKSCLFIGFSFTDINISAFLQSIIEQKGAHVRHYAIIYQPGDVITYYNERCMNITTIPIQDFNELYALLDNIASDIK